VPVTGTRVEERLTVPPGRHRFRFDCDGHPVKTPAPQFFRVECLSLEEATTLP
jgi:hypothetical protein